MGILSFYGDLGDREPVETGGYTVSVRKGIVLLVSGRDVAVIVFIPHEHEEMAVLHTEPRKNVIPCLHPRRQGLLADRRLLVRGVVGRQVAFDGGDGRGVFYEAIIGVAPDDQALPFVGEVKGTDEGPSFDSRITRVVQVVGIGIVHGPAVEGT